MLSLISTHQSKIFVMLSPSTNQYCQSLQVSFILQRHSSLVLYLSAAPDSKSEICQNVSATMLFAQNSVSQDVNSPVVVELKHSLNYGKCNWQTLKLV